MTRGANKEDAANDGEDYLSLNEDEKEMLEGLKGLKDDGVIKSITVIINSANPISTGFLFDEELGVDAAMWVGSVGQTGLYAVGDVVARYCQSLRFSARYLVDGQHGKPRHE